MPLAPALMPSFDHERTRPSALTSNSRPYPYRTDEPSSLLWWTTCGVRNAAGNAGQQVPDVAVPAALAGREVGGLVHELRQEVDGLGHRVAGLVDPQRRVVLAGLLVGVVADPRGVGQQVADGDFDRDLRAGQVDQLVDGLVEPQAAGLYLLQHGDRRAAA